MSTRKEVRVMNCLFLYGTLMNYDKPKNYSVKGQLYNTGRGAFPGIVLGGDNRVLGQLVQVDDIELRRLDIYEGVPNLYRREKVFVEKSISSFETCYIDNWEPLGDAWIYVWNSKTDGIDRIDSWPLP